MNATRLGIATVVVALLAVPVAAHVPGFPTDNTSPERAVHVHDPVKTWSFYDRLDRGEARYYELHFAAGERLSVSTYTPSGGNLTPSIVLMGPALNGTGDVPGGVTVPDGWGAVVVHGERPRSARYEPFAPAANYHTASIARTVEEEGHYLVAIYDANNRSGPVGVAVGTREAFSVREYATVAFDRVRIHRWSGGHPLVVFGPPVATVLAGAAAFRRRRNRRDRSAFRIVLAAGALSILGAGASTFVRMGIALYEAGPTAGALVTAIYVLVPAVCGLWGLRVAARDELAPTARTRAGLVVAGLASAATWAGYLVGPAAFLAAALVPTRPAE